MGACRCLKRYTHTSKPKYKNMTSTHTDCSSPSRKGKHLNESERQQIERWLKEKKSVREIAQLLQRHRSTIYREIKRGLTTKRNSDLSESQVYRAQRAEDDYQKNSGGGGPYLKLSWDSEECKKLQELMTTNELSPYAAMQILRENNPNINFSDRSLYNYINKYQYPISCSELPMRGRKRKSKTPCSKRLAHNNVKGESIEKRPVEANERSEVGHWEMDLVVGAKGGSKVLLVLTERKTRYEYVILLKDKTQKSVITALNKLERKYGAVKFRETFKTITCDNGSEFLDFTSLEKSCLNTSTRTKIYYAHPFASFERGSNENANRMIRRILPKSTIFDKLKQRDVSRLATWMNRYPRRIFDGRSAQQMARAEKLHFIKITV